MALSAPSPPLFALWGFPRLQGESFQTPQGPVPSLAPDSLSPSLTCPRQGPRPVGWQRGRAGSRLLNWARAGQIQGSWLQKPGPAPPKSLLSHRTLFPSSDQTQGLHGTVMGMGLWDQAWGSLAPPGLLASSQLTYLPPYPSLRPLPGQTEPHLLHQSLRATRRGTESTGLAILAPEPCVKPGRVRNCNWRAATPCFLCAHQESSSRHFPGDPVVKTLHSQCRGMDSTPGQWTKIHHAAWCGLKKEWKITHNLF